MPHLLRRFLTNSKFVMLFAMLLASAWLGTGLDAQDETPPPGSPQCVPAKAPPPQPGVTPEDAVESHRDEPGAGGSGGSSAAPYSDDAQRRIPQTDDAPEVESQSRCPPAPAIAGLSRYMTPSYLSWANASSYSSSLESNPVQDAQVAAITRPRTYPVSPKTGKWGGEQWRPAILQTLGFTLVQNGYRLATEEKTRDALLKETWHSYWTAISGLHTWSDGGKTWTVYVAHPAQGAVFNDIWTEHDPHGALVPFGFNHPYWASRIKAFWWDSIWELQWKFGPFSEASIGNVGLIPGKLGANTIVSSAVIGTGLAIGEDVVDRYWIAPWEKHTNNLAARAVLRGLLNPDRSFANLLRKKYPWYRDTRPTLRDLAQ